MVRPIKFFDPDTELQSLQECADAIFTSAYQLRQETGASAPSIQDVFPLLHEKAANLGIIPVCPITFEPFSPSDLSQKRATLRALITRIGRITPFAIEHLLGLSSFPEPAQPSKPPQLTVAADITPSSQPTLQAGSSNFSVRPHGIPGLSPVPAVLAPAGSETSESEKATSSRKTDISYSVTQDLLKVVHIKILGEVIYNYTGTYYSHITAENLRRLILAVSRPAVESEGNARLVGEVYKLLLCEPQICEKPERISGNLVSLRNGVLDLRSNQLYPHGSQYNTYYEIRANYLSRPKPHPCFDSFLASITQGDSILAQRILETIGYCLVPDMHGKVFFVFQGVPDSGKSVLAAFIRSCLNDDAVVAMDILSLGERFSASALIGKQLCTSMDLPSTPLSAKSVSSFKMITGGDPLTCDIKYAPHVTFYNTAKFIFGTNHPMLTQSSDYAFYRRAVVVPFLHTIPKAFQDFNLLEKLTAEREAIVYDALQAYLRLRRNNYEFSGTYGLNDMFDASSIQSVSPSVDTMVADFVQQHCTVTDDGISFVSDLYAAFCTEYGTGIVASTRFSTLLLSACVNLGLNNVEKLSKQRIAGEGNPRARIRGLILRQS